MKARKSFIVYVLFPVNHEYEFNKKYKRRIIRKIDVSNESINVTITDGLFSFENKNEAIEYGKILKYPIVKCIIPKKAKYYKGTFNSTEFSKNVQEKQISGICSAELIYKEELAM